MDSMELVALQALETQRSLPRSSSASSSIILSSLVSSASLLRPAPTSATLAPATTGELHVLSPNVITNLIVQSENSATKQILSATQSLSLLQNFYIATTDTLARANKRIQKFIKDHKTGIIIVGILGAMAIYGVYTVKKHWQSLKHRAFHRLKLQSFFLNTQGTCASTVVRLLPVLNESICRALPIPSTDQLRRSVTSSVGAPPAQKYALWEKCKVSSFARLITSAYGLVMVVMLLRVQLNLVGRYLYLETLIQYDPSAAQKLPEDIVLEAETQRKFLAYSEYLLNEGICELANRVYQIVAQVMSSYPLNSQCTFEEVLRIIDEVRLRVEEPLGAGGDCFLNQCLLPPEDDSQHSDSLHSKLQMLLNETRDEIESDKFNNTMNRCINLVFFTLSREFQNLYPPPQLQPAKPKTENNNIENSNGHENGHATTKQESKAKEEEEARKEENEKKFQEKDKGKQKETETETEKETENGKPSENANEAKENKEEQEGVEHQQRVVGVALPMAKIIPLVQKLVPTILTTKPEEVVTVVGEGVGSPQISEIHEKGRFDGSGTEPGTGNMFLQALANNNLLDDYAFDLFTAYVEQL